MDQPIFGLPMEYLTKGLDDKITRAYYDYMVNIAEIFGADRGSALSQMDDSLTFEMKLANVSLREKISKKVTNKKKKIVYRFPYRVKNVTTTHNFIIQ